MFKYIFLLVVVLGSAGVGAIVLTYMRAQGLSFRRHHRPRHRHRSRHGRHRSRAGQVPVE